MMDYIEILFDLVFHIDIYLADLMTHYQGWIYLILFLIVFCETGLVFAAFLPGDSLLFVTGTLAAIPMYHVNVHLIAMLLIIAAILGDTANYWIGKRFGEKLLQKSNSRLFNRKRLEKTHRFYETYGGKTIILARFIPFIRTFAPFVAGMGEMNYKKFVSYNVFGGIGWVVLLVYTGYFLGGFSIIQNNISWLILIIIILANLPAVISLIRRKNRKTNH